MIPKVKFGYSDAYENALSKRSFKFNHKKRIAYEKVAKKFQSRWDKVDSKILFSMSRLTYLKWKQKEIECYLSSEAGYSYSHPLTIGYKIGWSFDYLIAFVTHELSHIFFWSNKESIILPNDTKQTKNNIGFYKNYSKESYMTKLHIPVHALVILVIKKVFGKNAEKYLKWERWWEWSPDPSGIKGKDFKRSWEIVEKEGPENILKQIIKR